MGAENLCHLGRCPAVRGRFGRPPGVGQAGRRWDDLRLVGLKLIFLVVRHVMSLFRLSRRESWWKDAEILMLRHQLAVVERERPKARARLTWPDRAWLALLADTVPAGSLAGMRLLVTPGTILRWHRDIVRRRWGRSSRRGRSGRPAGPSLARPARPLAADDVAVPAQDRARGHDQPHHGEAPDGQRPGEQRQPRPVRPRETRMSTSMLALGHSELMAQHQDLSVLPPRLAARQTQQRHGPGNNQEDQLQAHKPKIIACPARPGSASHVPGHGTDLPTSGGRICPGGAGFRHP